MEKENVLILVGQGGQQQNFKLPTGNIVLGRSEINDIVINDPKVSRNHARFECTDSGCSIVDLGSRNGLAVNGRRVKQATLNPGDLIRIGNSTLRFESGEPRVEPEVTCLDTEADVKASLEDAALSTQLADNHAPSIVIRTPAKTWELALAQEAFTIGRHPDSNIVLDSAKVSRNHARIERRRDEFVIRDLNSANGVWLGDERLSEHTLQDGESIRIGDTYLFFKGGFVPGDLEVPLNVTLGKAKLRPVLFIPGILGSELYSGSERIWPNITTLFSQSEVDRLRADRPLEARAVVQEVVVLPNVVKLAQYNRLGNYLVEELGYERGRNLLEFPYDWRQDCRVSAQRLADAVSQWRTRSKDADQPITIVAHSLGSLVSRYYIERLGGKNDVERVIFLGAPHFGVPRILATLVVGPKMLPFGILGERFRQVLATFPSAYQMLPSYGCVKDGDGAPIKVLSDESWISEAQRPFLKEARQFRRELGARCSIPSVSIFGYGIDTITGAKVQRIGKGPWQKVDFISHPGGDNSVPETVATLEGGDFHPVRQHHGSLFADSNVKMRLRLELARQPGKAAG